MPVFEAVDAEQIQDLICVVCLNPWTDPIEVKPCGHIFCRGCVGGNNVTRCHMCRGDVTSTGEPNRILSNMAKEARMKCTTCAWVGTNQERLTHQCGSAPPQPPQQPATTTAVATGSPTGSPHPQVVPIPPQQPQAVNFVPYQPQPQPQQLAQPPHQQQQQSPPPTVPPMPNMPAMPLPGGYQAPQQQQPPQPPPPPPQPYITEPVGPWTQYELTQSEYDHIMCIFMTFDTDDSGSLDRGELQRLARYLNFAHSKQDIDNMFREMDRRRIGHLDMHSFCSWLSRNRPDPQQLYGLDIESYHAALFQFHEYDRDNSGLLDVQEFRQLSIRMGYARNPVESDNLFRAIDTDRSGEVDLHELLTFLRNRKLGVSPQSPPPLHQQQHHHHHHQQHHQHQHHHSAGGPPTLAANFAPSSGYYGEPAPHGAAPPTSQQPPPQGPPPQGSPYYEYPPSYQQQQPPPPPPQQQQQQQQQHLQQQGSNYYAPPPQGGMPNNAPPYDATEYHYNTDATAIPRQQHAYNRRQQQHHQQRQQGKEGECVVQ